MTRRRIPIAEFEHDPENPRTITYERAVALGRSMVEFGDLSGLVFNRRTGQYVGGHQRSAHIPEDAKIEVVRSYDEPTEAGTVALGFVDVAGERWAVRVVDVDIETQRAMNVSANAERGEWDVALLAAALEGMDAESDFEAVGFTEAEIEAILFAGEPASTNGDEEEKPRGIADGFVRFAFGEYRGLVSVGVYDEFERQYLAHRDDSGAVILDDVMRAWLTPKQ